MGGGIKRKRPGHPALVPRHGLGASYLRGSPTSGAAVMDLVLVVWRPRRRKAGGAGRIVRSQPEPGAEDDNVGATPCGGPVSGRSPAGQAEEQARRPAPTRADVGVFGVKPALVRHLVGARCNVPPTARFDNVTNAPG